MLFNQDIKSKCEDCIYSLYDREGRVSMHDTDAVTHFHKSPVVVHLLTGLEEVAAISPHRSVLLGDDGRTYTSQRKKRSFVFKKSDGGRRMGSNE